MNDSKEYSPMLFSKLRIGNGFKFCIDGPYMIKTSAKTYKNSETGKFVRIAKPKFLEVLPSI